jgi:hypothetical protein
MAAGPGRSRDEAEAQSFDDTGFRSGINACRNGKSRSDLSKGGIFGVSAMRTGTRWTIFVKFPVAFSGGMTLKMAPAPGSETLDVAMKDVIRQNIRNDCSQLPRRHTFELVFFEVCVNP